MWDWQRQDLSGDYRTIVIDNRGTGNSDEPEGPYTVEMMASDVETVLADAGVTNAHVAGASLGGMIAQQYVLDYGRAAPLTLLCTTPGGEESVPIPDETLDRMLNVPEEYDRIETIRHKLKPAFTDEFWERNRDVIDRIVDWRLETDPTDEGYEWQSAAAVYFDVSDRLDKITLPTLILHGTADRVVPVENADLLEAGIPDAELVTIEGAPHLLFIERADDVTERIRRFLADV